MLMGSVYDSMCTPESSSRQTRRGGKTKDKAKKQPQRGPGVAQLEKIRLHNQMMAAYRSGGQQDGGRIMQHHQVPFSAPSAELLPGSSPFQTSSYHHGVQYYGNLQPYSSSPPPPSLFAHDVRDSSGHRLGHQHHYWLTTTAEELDLELRL